MNKKIKKVIIGLLFNWNVLMNHIYFKLFIGTIVYKLYFVKSLDSSYRKSSLYFQTTHKSGRKSNLFCLSFQFNEKKGGMNLYQITVYFISYMTKGVAIQMGTCDWTRHNHCLLDCSVNPGVNHDQMSLCTPKAIKNRNTAR